MHTPKALLVSVPALALSLTLAACSAATPGGSPPESPAPPSATPLGDGHGRIAGATEVPEPQLHLLALDPGGSVDMLDLADGTLAHLTEVDGISSIATDGRYVFTSSATTGSVTVIDSGVWTWDHEDHFHYYRGEPKVVGTVEGEGEAVVTPGASATGIFFPRTGEVVVLDHDTLATGEVGATTVPAVEPHAGLAVPLSRSVLVTQAAAGGTAGSVQVHGAGGESVAGATAPCAGAQGTITTSVGVVIGCDDGALLAMDDGDDVAFEHIPYPADVDVPRATEFRAREGRPTVAAVAGDQGAWLLDTRERSWQFIATDVPLLRVAAVDDREGHVVALGLDGRVRVLSAETGGTLATTGPLLPETLADPALLQGVELIADQQRAYLNAPAERRLHEIDFADGARLARSFDTATAPAFLAETGR